MVTDLAVEVGGAAPVSPPARPLAASTARAGGEAR
jgi:hypothetical protein